VRSVVLTGVSRGLGAALFELLVARGDRVLALGRRFTAAQHAVAAAEPARVRLLAADLRDPPELREPFTAFLSGASESVLLHNAGVVEPVGAVGTLPAADLAAAVTVNLTAPMLLTNAFLAARPAGLPTRIVFVSSGAAARPVRGWSAYCAAKAGGAMFFEVVAAEHPDVRVACVNPGRMDTSMQATLRAVPFPDQPDYVDAHRRGALADPADVARRIVAEHLGA